MGHHIDVHSRKTLQESLGEVLGTGFKQKKVDSKQTTTDMY